jgi:S-phase kinase-associated protein 1
MSVVLSAVCDNGEKLFTVPLEIANQLVTIKNIVDDLGDMTGAAPIPLPNVKADTLEWIIGYLSNSADPKSKARDLSTTALSIEKIFEIALATNYLDCQEILDQACAVIAGTLKNKTPEEIRAQYGIVNDFTPEEMEAVKKEYEWALTD